jgi:hypothetical protein
VFLLRGARHALHDIFLLNKIPQTKRYVNVTKKPGAVTKSLSTTESNFAAAPGSIILP